MNKIIATIIKEWQLMKRDISGLLLLLGLPAAMIIVMSIVQDAPYRDYQELRFDLLLVDNDHGSVARQITAGLKQSHNFHVTDSIGGQPLTDETLKQQVNAGTYKIGIVIPEGATAEVVNAANILVNSISARMGTSAHQPVREARAGIYVHLYFDPVSKPAFRSAISAAMDKFIAWSSSEILMQRLSVLNKSADSTAGPQPDIRKVMQGIGVKEESLNKRITTIQVSSVQHNVPAWAIFGMFFIAIPIAGHVIREREDGSAMRIGLIPTANHYVAMGKIIFYTLICTLQFVLMMCIGKWVMPFFHLPALQFGLHPWALLPIPICTGFAATAYGFFIGSIFRTVIQALPFAGISIVILSAIGGIWVPIEILPPTMQTIALLSPLHWSLEAVNEVILRNSGLAPVIQPICVLLCTGILLWLASIALNRRYLH